MGYAAFSYADLSERVGIRKASIHHHFPTKEDLGTAVIDAYLERFIAELEALAARSVSPKRKLLAYGDFFATSLQDGQMPCVARLLRMRPIFLPPCSSASRSSSSFT